MTIPIGTLFKLMQEKTFAYNIQRMHLNKVKLDFILHNYSLKFLNTVLKTIYFQHTSIKWKLFKRKKKHYNYIIWRYLLTEHNYNKVSTEIPSLERKYVIKQKFQVKMSWN